MSNSHSGFGELPPSYDGLRHDPIVLLYRGNELLNRGNIEEAITVCALAIQYHPELAEAYYLSGTCRYAARAYNQALIDYREALRRGPNVARYHGAYGTTAEQLGDYETAIASYGQTIAIEPEYLLGYISMANVLATCPIDSLRRADRAVECATIACTISPTDWRSFAVLAAAHAEMRQFDRAVEAATHALQLAPESEMPGRQARIDLYRSGRPFRASRQ